MVGRNEDLWHRQYGHLSNDGLRQMQFNVVNGDVAHTHTAEICLCVCFKCSLI